MKLTHSLVFAAALGTALFPLTSFATTPQQILNQAMQLSAIQQINVAQGTFSMQTTKTPLPAMRTQFDGGRDGAQLNVRLERPSTPGGNFQGYVEMQNFFDTAMNHPTPVALNPTPRMTFRAVDRTVYLQLSGIATLLQATGLGITLTPEQVTNLEQWVHVDGTDTSESSLVPALPSESIIDGQAKFMRLLALATTKKIPLLSVISASHQKDQPKTLRLSVRVNPAFLSLAQTQLLKEAGKDVMKRKDVNTMFTSIRNDLKTTKIVAVVDTSVAAGPKLIRLEIADTKTSIEKGCAYKRLDKNGVGIESSYSCTLNTLKSVDTITGALNLSSDPSVQVAAPSNPASLKTLLNQLFQQMMGGDAETSTTTSTVSST